jgi:hypothetical protein
VVVVLERAVEELTVSSAVLYLVTPPMVLDAPVSGWLKISLVEAFLTNILAVSATATGKSDVSDSLI